MEPVVLGIDIGGTNIAYGLCNKDGKITSSGEVPTNSFSSPDKMADSLFETLAIHRGAIQAIGIGAPNGNFHTGSIEFAPNLLWKGSIPLGELFGQKFGVPVTVTNDANAAAIGEMVFGNAQDLSNFVTITLGTGLGSGIVIDEHLIHGFDGFAGEFGHIRVFPGGRNCGCGRKGCLETYASSTGVIRSIKELDSPLKMSSALNENRDWSALDVFKLADSGDPFAQEIVRFTAKTLGSALADFACFSNPKAYILFGGIAQNGPEFALAVKEAMEAELLNIYQHKIEIRTSALHDQNAAVLGAASLAWKQL